MLIVNEYSWDIGINSLVAVADEEIGLDFSQVSEVNVSWAMLARVLQLYQDLKAVFLIE